MLRVHSNSVLVVPPFECAWLTGEEFLLRDGKGCISFEVKGDRFVNSGRNVGSQHVLEGAAAEHCKPHVPAEQRARQQATTSSGLS